MLRITAIAMCQDLQPVWHMMCCLQVTGSFAGVISLRLTPNQRSSVDVDTALQRYCSRIFRSHTNPKPQPTAGAGRAAGTPFVVDTKEAVKAMLLDTVLANNPKLDGSGIKIGACCH